MNFVYLLTGSNLDDRLSYLNFASSEIEKQLGKIEKKSSIYESESWGFHANKFLNQVIYISTEYSTLEILGKIQSIENDAGRIRISKEYESRTLDIDILFFNKDILQTEELIIPHPRMHLRKFTLLPLSEIAGDYLHPEFQKNISTLASECLDNGTVTIYNQGISLTNNSDF